MFIQQVQIFANAMNINMTNILGLHVIRPVIVREI
jgi:hypothetical protein